MIKRGLVRSKGSQNLLVSMVRLSKGASSCRFAPSHAADETGFCREAGSTTCMGLLHGFDANHEQRLLRHKLQNINAACGTLCQHESLSQEVSPQFSACRAKATAVLVMLLQQGSAQQRCSHCCIGGRIVSCIVACIVACMLAHIHTALQSISCSQALAHQLGTASAAHEPRPCAQKCHQADLNHLQSPSRNGKHCQADECAGIGGRLVPAHLLPGGDPTTGKGHGHHLQVNRAALQGMLRDLLKLCLWRQKQLHCIFASPCDCNKQVLFCMSLMKQ